MVILFNQYHDKQTDVLEPIADTACNQAMLTYNLPHFQTAMNSQHGFVV